MNSDIIRRICNSNRNLIINGDMSTGKTKNVIFPLLDKIINNNESFIVIDPKEEYIRRYYNLVKNNEYNTIIINLRNNKNDNWNILDVPYNLYLENKIDESIDALLKIGKDLFYENKNTDPFWKNISTDFFVGVCLYVFKNVRNEEINISSINHLLNGEEIKNVDVEKLKNDEQIYSFISPTINAPKETKESIITLVREKINELTNQKKLNNLLGKTTFNYKEINNKKTAIFFVTKDEETNINYLASIFINQLFILLFNNCKNRFNFILDNIDTINYIDNLVNLLSSGISRNIKFIVSTRSKQLLKEKYTSYVNSLADEIKVNDKTLNIKFNNESVKVENINIKDDEKTNEEIEVNITEEKELLSTDEITINDLIESIDKQIKELEKEEEKIKNL